MVRFVILILVVGSIETNGQESKNLKPTLGHLIDLSSAGEAEYQKDEFMDIGYYDIVGYTFDSQKASSELPSDTIDYAAKNAADLSYKTAWVEGVPGYGIGESLIFKLQSDHPPITKIVLVNGFVKSKKLWEEYSRVKSLEMFVNNKPFAKLDLMNTREEQEFAFRPGDWDKFKNHSLTIEFKILDIYKGDKFDKTAITEIYIREITVNK